MSEYSEECCWTWIADHCPRKSGKSCTCHCHTSPLPDLVLRTKGHPEANGHRPSNGEHAWSLRFPLEDGRTLVVEVGAADFENFERVILQQRRDDALEQIGVQPPAPASAAVGEVDG